MAWIGGVILGVCCRAQAGEIHDAVRAGDLARVQALIAADARAVRSATDDGLTPLHVAVQAEREDLVQALVAAGADLTAISRSGDTPLRLAVQGKSIAVVKELLIRTNCAYTERFLDARTREGDVARRAGILQQASTMLGALVRDDPANPNINFAGGLVCASLGDFSRARLAFERVLQATPNNARARAELARAHMALGQSDLAREEFRAALASSPTPAVRQNIEQHLRQIARSQRRWTGEGRVDAGYLWDDNVNVGPRSTFVDIDPIRLGATKLDRLEVAKGSRPLEADGPFASVNATAARDVGAPREWQLLAGVGYYQNWMEDARDREMLFAEATAGLRFLGEQSVWDVPLRFSSIEEGDDVLVRIYGVRPSYVWAGGAAGEMRWIGSGCAEYRDYAELDERDAVQLTAAETVQWRIGAGDHSVFGGVTVFYNDADKEMFGYGGGGVRLGVEVNLPWDIVFYGQGRVEQSWYRAKEPLAPETREDTKIQAVAGLNKAVGWGLGLDVNYNYTDNRSTFDLYEYERGVLSMSTYWRF